MLSSTAAPSSQTSYGNAKQIVAKVNGGNFVMYTVPTGKKFQGTVYCDTAAQPITFTPAGGAAVTVSNIPTGYLTAPFLLTLVAGTIVTAANANTNFLIGVETDA